MFYLILLHSWYSFCEVINVKVKWKFNTNEKGRMRCHMAISYRRKGGGGSGSLWPNPPKGGGGGMFPQDLDTGRKGGGGAGHIGQILPKEEGGVGHMTKSYQKRRCSLGSLSFILSDIIDIMIHMKRYSICINLVPKNWYIHKFHKNLEILITKIS